MAPEDRKTALMRFTQLIEDTTEELAVMETIDAGKPIKHTLSRTSPVRSRRRVRPLRAVRRL